VRAARAWRTAARSRSVATLGRAAARCSVAALLLRWYQRSGVLTHTGALVACTTLIVHATRRMPWALHRAVRVGSRRAGRAVRRAACSPLGCRAGMALTRPTRGWACVLEGGSRAARHRVSLRAGDLLEARLVLPGTLPAARVPAQPLPSTSLYLGMPRSLEPCRTWPGFFSVDLAPVPTLPAGSSYSWHGS
jgi:hypothetical protein